MRLVTLTHLAALALLGERILAWTAPKTHAALLDRARPKNWKKGLPRQVRAGVRTVAALAVANPQLTAQAASLAGGVLLGRSGRKVERSLGKVARVH